MNESRGFDLFFFVCGLGGRRETGLVKFLQRASIVVGMLIKSLDLG